ncbi:uncharacterized protein LOC126659607 isoform X2 [Mercurialis annua]|uniref:uncharacterized protein LOC126659607 isoform X2 n=1 Tax=Mercurialis annua TaxID=3986 RepID=UPI00215DE1FA|nr:uncharacterized protein LOC126659607 isoform X2 [Mercurialis annua]
MNHLQSSIVIVTSGIKSKKREHPASSKNSPVARKISNSETQVHPYRILHALLLLRFFVPQMKNLEGLLSTEVVPESGSGLETFAKDTLDDTLSWKVKLMKCALYA